MNIQTKAVLFFITSLLLFVDITCAACPRHLVPHTVKSTTVCCRPVFNCGKDHEVRFCLQNGEADKCIPCGNKAINPHITTSVDKKHHVCFNVTRSHEDCPIEDTFPVAVNEFCKEMYCSCKTEECRYGSPCLMCKKGSPCGVNEEMNAKTGACEPCGDLMYSPAGCGPCIYNETAWRLANKAGTLTKDPSSSHKATTNFMPEITKVDLFSASVDSSLGEETAYNIATETLNNTSTEKAQTAEEDSFSMTPVIIIIVVLVAIGILVALFLYVKKKIKDGDENSRLVVCYRKLVSSARYSQGTNQGDPEAAPPNGDISHERNADNRQTQAVSPMVRETECVEGASGGAECSENVRIALLKEESEAGNEDEETAHKES